MLARERPQRAGRARLDEVREQEDDTAFLRDVPEEPRGRVDVGPGAARLRGRVARVTCQGREPGSVLNVNWVITRHCNFSCSSCTAYDNSVAYPSERDLKSAVDKIAKLGRPDVKVVLTGGEPTLHPGYIGFVKHMAERLPNLSTRRTETNLSRTPRFYSDLVEATNGHTGILAFHGSYHFEFTDLDRFLANARFLSEHGIGVQLRLLAHPERMPEVRRLAEAQEAEPGEESPADSAVVDALPPNTALLVVRRGPNAGSRFLLDSELTEVGRRPDSDIFLDDVTVSRRHAEFYRQGGRFAVRDVGSLNGTYVNRERIEETALSGGDEVQIGKFRLVCLQGRVSHAESGG